MKQNSLSHYWGPVRDFFRTRKPKYAKIIDDVIAYYDKEEPNSATLSPEICQKIDYFDKVIRPEYMKSLPRRGCPECRGEWTLTFPRNHKGFLKYRKYINAIQKLKYGELYRCEICRLQWYLDDNGENMHAVPRDQEELLQEWSKRKCAPGLGIIAILKNIGALRVLLGGYPSERIDIPCKCRVGGRWIDFCVMVFRKNPPWDDIWGCDCWKRECGCKNIVFGDEVQAVAVSDYAVPLEVSIFMENVEPKYVEFSPVYVGSTGGKEFIISRGTYFFSAMGQKGKDLIPTRKRLGEFFSRKEAKLDSIDSSPGKLTWAICDWFDDCEKLMRGLLLE